MSTTATCAPEPVSASGQNRAYEWKDGRIVMKVAPFGCMPQSGGNASVTFFGRS